MDERRRAYREAKEAAHLAKHGTDRIADSFADLKRKLADVSAAEWDAIPDIGDTTIKKTRRDFFAPAPDTLLARAVAEQEVAASIDASGGGGPGLTAGGSLTEVGDGRRTVVSLNLDRAADSVDGQTVVDPKGYLTSLSSMKISSAAEVGDIKKARTLLRSVTATNPRHAPGWVAAARLEEVAGKLADARSLAQKGCELCPGSEDVWLEAARLARGGDAAGVLARGVAALPRSVRLWTAAADLETDPGAKSRVLRKALERVPTSVALWRAAVDLAPADDARVLLARAVECCPQHVELWLALARLESYANAQKVLNRARLAVPTDAAIWFAAAKLEEAAGRPAMVPKIVERAVKSLTANAVVIDRDAWLKVTRGGVEVVAAARPAAARPPHHRRPWPSPPPLPSRRRVDGPRGRGSLAVPAGGEQPAPLEAAARATPVAATDKAGPDRAVWWTALTAPPTPLHTGRGGRRAHRPAVPRHLPRRRGRRRRPGHRGRRQEAHLAGGRGRRASAGVGGDGARGARGRRVCAARQEIGVARGGRPGKGARHARGGGRSAAQGGAVLPAGRRERGRGVGKASRAHLPAGAGGGRAPAAAFWSAARAPAPRRSVARRAAHRRSPRSRPPAAPPTRAARPRRPRAQPHKTAPRTQHPPRESLPPRPDS
jgi:tetratricopeptide (TPR) repeat protein